MGKKATYLAKTSDSPIGLEIERAEGIYIYDTNGKAYIDLISGIGVNNLGHRHPSVVRAITGQTEKYLHTMVYGEFAQEPQETLAALLADNLPGSLNTTYFTNSGSEAIEGALKLAKRATGRKEIISFGNAYHGSTHGALSIMGSSVFKDPFEPLLAGTEQLPFNDIDALSRITTATAAVVIEPIQGEAGVNVPDDNYLQALRKRCDETGALLVFDEVQTGFGRTGKLFAFEHYDVVPDILVLAKALGGGMPLGAFIASGKLMDNLSHDPALGHITTFGGHPVSCAAAKASLEALIGERHIASVNEKEALFREYLQHPAIKEVRSKGLLMAAELGDAEKRERVCHYCIEAGLITDWFLFCDTAIRIAPPLTITSDEIKKACDIITTAIEKS